MTLNCFGVITVQYNYKILFIYFASVFVGIHNDHDTAEFVRENALSGHWKPVKHWSYDDDNDEEHHVVERQWGSSWTYLYNDSSIDDDPAKKGVSGNPNSPYIRIKCAFH